MIGDLPVQGFHPGQDIPKDCQCIQDTWLRYQKDQLHTLSQIPWDLSKIFIVKEDLVD